MVDIKKAPLLESAKNKEMQIKDNKISPQFYFGNIGIEEIKEDAETILRQLNETNEIEENEFPVNVFPSRFRDVIDDCYKSLNFPNDYTGTAIIAAVSTAIGKSSKLKVKSNWYESPAFYFSLIGNAGSNKSHPLETAFKPFEEIDRAIIERYKKDHEDFEAYQAISKKEKETQHKPERPVLIKTILHNFTGEILHQRLTDNERGCIIVSEELATFLEGMNNYSKGDQSSTYLSFWSNKSTSIDRVSRPVPLWLPQPFLNIIGSLQPRVLQKLFPAGKSDNGFLQRFLFAFPNNAEKQPINDYEINETVFDNYSKWIERFRLVTPILIDPETEKPNPKIYYWSLDAKKYFYQWQKENTGKVNDNSDNLKGEILSKFDIHFVRLSLVLQIMQDYETNEISLQAVQGAEKLCTYFERCAMKVLNILENGNPTDNMPVNKIMLYNSLPEHFTTSEANAIGEGLQFNIKAVQRFLNNENLFARIVQGQYSKKQKNKLS